MCQDVPGVKSIKSVASLSRTFAASSIGSMKPKPFFSLNLRTWHLVWAQECQMQDEQQNSSKNTHATISAHHPKSKTLGVGQVGRCFQTLAVTPAWHCAIFKTISGFNTGCQAISLGHAREVLHPPPAKRSEAAKQDGNWVDSVDLSDLFGVLRACSLPFAGASACIGILSILTLWHHYGIIMASLYGIIMARVMDADGTCSVRWTTNFLPGLWTATRFQAGNSADSSRTTRICPVGLGDKQDSRW